LVDHFEQHPKTQACSIYFEHQFNHLDKRFNEGILQYELFLRYYVQALRFAGHPYAFHTVGSAMAVRAQSYREQGGMNTRQAAEDFHFLQKFIELGKLTDLTTTTVFPASRISNRVPFGTGKAMTDWIENNATFLPAYHINIFKDLKIFLDRTPELYSLQNNTEIQAWVKTLPESVQLFLEPLSFENVIKNIQENTASRIQFTKRWFRWFNGLKALQFVHFAQKNGYPNQPILEASQALLKIKNETIENQTAQLILEKYRQWDRNEKYAFATV
jgi:hypothetical protein